MGAPMTHPAPPDLRVSFVVDSGGFGGAHVYLRHLLRGLPPELRRSLVVAGPVARYFEDLADHLEEVVVVPLAEGRGSAPETVAALAKLQPDIAMVNLIAPALNRAALAAAVGSGPAIAALHMTGGSGPTAHRAELVDLYSGLRHVVAVSAPIERQLHDELGVPPHRITRI